MAAGCTGTERDRRARARRDADRLAQERERVRRQRRRVGGIAPAPPAHRGAVRLTDPRHQPLIRSRPSSASLERGRAPRGAPCSRRSGGDARCRALAQLDRHLGRRAAEPRLRAGPRSRRDCSTRANGVPRARWAQRQRVRGARRSATSSKSARTSLPLRVLITSVKASVLDVLHARHARPPARQVVGVADQLPQLLAGAAIVRLRRAVGTRRSLGLVAEQRVHLARRAARARPGTPARSGSRSHHLAAELLHELAQRRRRAPGGEQIVVDQHAAPPASASVCSSSWPAPYSSRYSALTVSYGSLPGLRASTKPAPSSSASAGPSRKPRASAATTQSTASGRPSRPAADRLGERAGVGHQRRDVLEDDPRLGKSGMSRISERSSARSSADDLAQVADQQQVLEVGGHGGEVLERVDAPPCAARGLRERSAGARICCSRFASRSAEERNTRRLRPPTP